MGLFFVLFCFLFSFRVPVPISGQKRISALLCSLLPFPILCCSHFIRTIPPLLSSNKRIMSCRKRFPPNSLVPYSPVRLQFQFSLVCAVYHTSSFRIHPYTVYRISIPPFLSHEFSILSPHPSLFLLSLPLSLPLALPFQSIFSIPPFHLCSCELRKTRVKLSMDQSIHLHEHEHEHENPREENDLVTS